MGNYHGYKCRECTTELDGLRNDNREKREDDDETIETWDAIFWCPNGCGELHLTIEETTWYDGLDGEEYQAQEIVVDRWKPFVR